jgi:hypothetical protein
MTIHKHKGKDRFFDVVASDPSLSLAQSQKKTRLWARPFLVSGVVVILVSVAVAAPFSFDAWRLLALTSKLQPITCSGDWENPGTLYDGSPAGVAAASTEGQKLFCSFASLESENSSSIVSATLSLTFAEGEDPSTTTTEEQPAAVIEALEDVEVSTESELPTAAVETEEIPIPEPESAEAIVEEVPVSETEPEELPTQEEATPEDPAQESQVQQEEVPEETAEEQPVSKNFWNMFPFLSSAHAQELPVEIPEELPVLEEPISEETEEAVLTEEETPAEVLGESSEQVSEEVDETAFPELELSYTTDGTVWTEVSTFEVLPGNVEFGLELENTDELETLVVRLTLVTAKQEVKVFLKGLRLDVVHGDEELQPIELEMAPFPQDVLPEPHQYRKEVSVDAAADHFCETSPSLLDLTRQESARFFVNLSHGTSTGHEYLDLGSMPYGIDMRFVNGNRYRFDRVEEQSEVEVSVSVLPGAQRGSLSIPIIYTKEREQDSSVICQINILNL